MVLPHRRAASRSQGHLGPGQMRAAHTQWDTEAGQALALQGGSGPDVQPPESVPCSDSRLWGHMGGEDFPAA